MLLIVDRSTVVGEAGPARDVPLGCTYYGIPIRDGSLRERLVGRKRAGLHGRDGGGSRARRRGSEDMRRWARQFHRLA